jgi:hypothetical protein
MLGMENNGYAPFMRYLRHLCARIRRIMAMSKYWLGKNCGAYEGWKLEGPFNNLADLQEEFEKVLSEGNSGPIKLFKELSFEVKEDA